MGGVNSAKKKKLSPDPLVHTEYGAVVGKKVYLKADGRILRIFLGIPFAEPPVGRLRFQKPEPPRPWRYPLTCQKYRNISIQKQMPGECLKFTCSEDCLYLNVIAPDWAPPTAEGFPVMFYVHGGGFLMDSAVNYNYNNIGRTLVRHGVIVVTVCYRLGILGFLSTSDDTVKGNFGLWDQYLALKFVHDNIQYFGGDPNNITVFGQSAGAVSTDLLSLSPVSRAMVSKTALLGGNCETIWGVQSRALGAKCCQEVALRLGFRRPGNNNWTRKDNKAMLEFLRNLPARKLGMTMIGNQEVFQKFRLPIGPIVDGEFLPEAPYLLRKKSPARPTIAGNCAHEGLVFLAMGFRFINAAFVLEMEERYKDMNGFVSEAFGEDARYPLEKIYLEYDVTKEKLRTKKFRQRAMVEMMDDVVNNIALYNYAKAEREKGSNVWMYYFDHHNKWITFMIKMFLPFNEATHATELAYLLDTNIFQMPYRKTADDVKVIDNFTKYFTNFAKFGNPNGNVDGSKSHKLGEAAVRPWDAVSDSCPERHIRILPVPIHKDKLPNRRCEKMAQFYERLNRYFCEFHTTNKNGSIVGTPRSPVTANTGKTTGSSGTTTDTRTAPK